MYRGNRDRDQAVASIVAAYERKRDQSDSPWNGGPAWPAATSKKKPRNPWSTRERRQAREYGDRVIDIRAQHAPRTGPHAPS